jgi:hypothetical protein
MLAFIQVSSFIGPLTVVPGILFWTKITVHESKTFWMQLDQKSVWHNQPPKLGS